jgi:hypothetical protein
MNARGPLANEELQQTRSALARGAAALAAELRCWTTSQVLVSGGRLE